MQAMPLKSRRAFIVAISYAAALGSFCNNANSQSSATGALWVDTNGNVIGPALHSPFNVGFGDREILLKIPFVGTFALPVDAPVYPTVLGDPIRWKYSFPRDYVADAPIVMSFESPDCSGQGYLYLPALFLEAGNTVVVSQFFDSVHHWLVVGAYPAIDTPPHFNSQIVQGSILLPPPLFGPGAYCQTVDVRQAGPVVPVTHVIDQQTLASPPLLLQ